MQLYPSEPSQEVEPATPKVERPVEPGRTESCSAIVPGPGQDCDMWWWWHSPEPYRNPHRKVQKRCRRGRNGRCSKYGKLGPLGRFLGRSRPYISNVSFPKDNTPTPPETQQGILAHHLRIASAEEFPTRHGGRAKKRPRKTRRGPKTTWCRRPRLTRRRHKAARRRSGTRRRRRS